MRALLERVAEWAVPAVALLTIGYVPGPAPSEECLGCAMHPSRQP